MERPEPQLENHELGENVIIHALFTRHGEKRFDMEDFNTELTPEGRVASWMQGKARSQVDAIKPYSSQTSRTIETAQLIAEASPTDEKLEQRIKHSLSMYFDHEGELVQRCRALKKKIFGDISSLDEKVRKQKLEEYDIAATDLFLSYGDKKPDPDTSSPQEAAAGMARVLDTYIRMADKLKSGSEVDLINGTHDWNIAAFLKEVIIRDVDGHEVRGFDKIEDIGGPIDFNEGFEARIGTDDSKQKSVTLFFRGQEYNIDQARFVELVQIAKDLEKHMS